MRASINMSYMTLVKERLPEDIQDIILDNVFEETRVKNKSTYWRIMNPIINLGESDCFRDCVEYRCNDSVCKCHCLHSVKFQLLHTSSWPVEGKDMLGMRGKYYHPCEFIPQPLDFPYHHYEYSDSSECES